MKAGVIGRDRELAAIDGRLGVPQVIGAMRGAPLHVVGDEIVEEQVVHGRDRILDACAAARRTGSTPGTDRILRQNRAAASGRPS